MLSVSQKNSATSRNILGKLDHLFSRHVIFHLIFRRALHTRQCDQPTFISKTNHFNFPTGTSVYSVLWTQQTSINWHQIFTVCCNIWHSTTWTWKMSAIYLHTKRAFCPSKKRSWSSLSSQHHPWSHLSLLDYSPFISFSKSRATRVKYKAKATSFCENILFIPIKVKRIIYFRSYLKWYIRPPRVRRDMLARGPYFKYVR